MKTILSISALAWFGLATISAQLTPTQLTPGAVPERGTPYQETERGAHHRVREGDADFRLFDTPLRYQPAIGPVMSLDLVYRTWMPTDYKYIPRNDANPLFGPQWHCAWSSDIVVSNEVDIPVESGKFYWNYLGGRILYDGFSGTPEISDPAPEDGSRLEKIVDGGNQIIGGKIHRKDGSILEYLQPGTETRQYLLTKLTDPRGESLTFGYDGEGRLEEITAATGETLSFTYGDLDGDSDDSNNRVVTQINAPGDLVATFKYLNIDDSNGSTTDWHLTNINDSINLPTFFVYTNASNARGAYWPLASMITPYGTNQFERPANSFGPALLVTQPDGGQHLYLFAEGGASPPLAV